MSDTMVDINFDFVETSSALSNSSIVTSKCEEIVIADLVEASTSLSINPVISLPAMGTFVSIPDIGADKVLMPNIIVTSGIALRVYTVLSNIGDTMAEIGVGESYFAQVTLTAFYNSNQVSITKSIKIPKG